MSGLESRLVGGCERCRRSQLTTIVRLRMNVSYLFGRHERQVWGNLCLPCMLKTFFTYESLTLVGTWWGFVGGCLGPFYLASNVAQLTKGVFLITRERRANIRAAEDR